MPKPPPRSEPPSSARAPGAPGPQVRLAYRLLKLAAFVVGLPAAQLSGMALVGAFTDNGYARVLGLRPGRRRPPAGRSPTASSRPTIPTRARGLVSDVCAVAWMIVHLRLRRPRRHHAPAPRAGGRPPRRVGPRRHRAGGLPPRRPARRGDRCAGAAAPASASASAGAAGDDAGAAPAAVHDGGAAQADAGAARPRANEKAGREVAGRAVQGGVARGGHAQRLPGRRHARPGARASSSTRTAPSPRTTTSSTALCACSVKFQSGAVFDEVELLVDDARRSISRCSGSNLAAPSRRRPRRRHAAAARQLRRRRGRRARRRHRQPPGPRLHAHRRPGLLAPRLRGPGLDPVLGADLARATPAAPSSTCAARSSASTTASLNGAPRRRAEPQPRRPDQRAEEAHPRRVPLAAQARPAGPAGTGRRRACAPRSSSASCSRSSPPRSGSTATRGRVAHTAPAAAGAGDRGASVLGVLGAVAVASASASGSVERAGRRGPGQAHGPPAPRRRARLGPPRPRRARQRRPRAQRRAATSRAAGVPVSLRPVDAMASVEGALARGGADKEGADIAVVPFSDLVASYERLRALSPEVFFVVGWSRGREALVSTKEALPSSADKPEAKSGDKPAVSMVGAPGDAATFLGLFALGAERLRPRRGAPRRAARGARRSRARRRRPRRARRRRRGAPSCSPPRTPRASSPSSPSRSTGSWRGTRRRSPPGRRVWLEAEQQARPRPARRRARRQRRPRRARADRAAQAPRRDRARLARRQRPRVRPLRPRRAHARTRSSRSRGASGAAPARSPRPRPTPRPSTESIIAQPRPLPPLARRAAREAQAPLGQPRGLEGARHLPAAGGQGRPGDAPRDGGAARRRVRAERAARGR